MSYTVNMQDSLFSIVKLEPPDDYHVESSACDDIDVKPSIAGDSLQEIIEIDDDSSTGDEAGPPSATSTKYPCSVCRQKFASIRKLNKHKRKLHTEVRWHQCDLCPKAFKCQLSLAAHRRKHLVVYPFECKYCPQGFEKAVKLSKHLVSAHRLAWHYAQDIVAKLSQFKASKARVIDKAPVKKSNITTTMHGCDEPIAAASITNVPNWFIADAHECEICHDRFESIADLQCHVEMHPRDEFNCPTCDRTFSYPADIYEHLRMKQCRTGTASLAEDEGNVKTVTVVRNVKKIAHPNNVNTVNGGKNVHIFENLKNVHSANDGKNVKILNNLKTVNTVIAGYSIEILDNSNNVNTDGKNVKPFHNLAKVNTVNNAKNAKEFYNLKNVNTVNDGRSPKILENVLPYDCYVCVQKFSEEKLRDRHMRRHPILECSVCQRVYQHIGHLKSHMKTHTAQKMYECTECGLCLLSKWTLTKHMARHSGARDTTNDLNEVFKYSGARDTTNDLNEVFERPVPMAEHRLTHSPRDNNKGSLGMRLTLDATDSLTAKKHVAITDKATADHSDDNAGSWTEVIWNFQDISDFHDESPDVSVASDQDPLLTIKDEPDDPSDIHECGTCDERFNCAADLHCHMELHSRVEFNCPTCDRTFPYQSDIYEHLKGKCTGTPPEKHECQCGKKFMLKSELNRHKSTHWAYSCKRCSRAFQFWQGLNRHSGTCR